MFTPELHEADQAYLRRCVETGVAHLDKYEPGWQDHIVVNTLDMTDLTQCVVGQTCAEYGRPTEPTRRYFASYGFDLDEERLGERDSEEAWEFLRSLWVEAVEARTKS